MHSKLTEEELRYLTPCLIQITITIFRQWINEGMKDDPKTIATMILTVSKRLLALH